MYTTAIASKIIFFQHGGFMKKVLILALVGLLFFAGTAFSQGVPFTGTVEVENDAKDGGTSVITMTTSTRDGAPAYRIQGRMLPGAQHPYVVLTFVPDDATRERLRSARNIHFKVLGDGNRFRMEYRTEAVTDHGHHAFNFRTTAAQTQQVSIQNRQFVQPSWATMMALQPRTAKELAIIPDDALRDGTPFDITVWDLRIE
jgi:preprotein translocase subunit SecF